MATTTWTSDRRLYLDRNGKVVQSDDPARATLLVPVGGTLPLERARSLGLVDAEGAAPAPAQDADGNPAKQAPANKAVVPVAAPVPDEPPAPRAPRRATKDGDGA